MSRVDLSDMTIEDNAIAINAANEMDLVTLVRIIDKHTPGLNVLELPAADLMGLLKEFSTELEKIAMPWRRILDNPSVKEDPE